MNIPMNRVMLALSPLNSELYETYLAGEDGEKDFQGVSWTAQTFTPSTKHDLHQVKIKLFKTGSPGLVSVSIRATSSGLPTATDLAIASTLDGNALGATPGVLLTLSMRPVLLQASTKYAIVVRAPSASGGDLLHWRHDNGGGYSGGDRHQSSDSGATWNAATASDLMFEEYGSDA